MSSNLKEVLSAEVSKIIADAPFLALATISKAGQPHLIIVGKAKEIKEDGLVFGVYKMEKTRENITETGVMQVAAASGKAGYRLSGKASVGDGEILFAVEKVESLL